MRIPKRFLIAAGSAAFCFYIAYTHYEVPVLMYHHVDIPEVPSALHVTPETFERQMEFLKNHHYRVISLVELAHRLRSGGNIPLKTVVITFDDGNLDNFTLAFPVLKKMGFPATVFMITSNISREGWLSEEDLKILDASGVEVGSHTLNHAFLPILGVDQALTEIRDSKKRLEEILGHDIVLFSYPAGGYDNHVRSLVEREDYRAAVTTNYGRRRHDPLAIHRIRVSEAGGNLFNFWLKTTGFYHVGKKRVEVR